MKSYADHFVVVSFPKWQKLLTWAVCLLFAVASPLLRAADLPSPFTVSLPFPVNQATPAWLGHPETPLTAFATLNVPVLTPDPNASLLVTVFFHEKQGGFLRITWQGTQGAQVLTENFYEGTGMSNQRSLLITSEMLAGDGTLSFQCGDATLGIDRIKFEWLENKGELVSSQIQDLLVSPTTGPTQLAQNLNGQPGVAAEAAWQDKFVTVPITDQPMRIEQGVEFSVQLDNIPTSGRLALKEAGLPLGQRLVVWINQQRAGTITPVVPDLADEGYLADTNTPDNYVGWRDGSFYVPVSLLKVGINSIQFSPEDQTPASNPPASPNSATPPAPLAVKDVVLQLNCPPAPTVPTTPAPQAATTPSDTTATPPPQPIFSTSLDLQTNTP